MPRRESDHHRGGREPRATAISWPVLLAFFALAYAVSWALWAPLAADALGWVDTTPSPYWHLAGGFGPLIAAVIVATATDHPVGPRGLLRQVVRWRVGPVWLVLGLLGPFALFLVATAIFRMVEGAWPALSRFGESTEYPRLPLLVFWAANIVCYGYGEEVGWRGFALPRLQDRFGAIQASSILSLFWALWHLPLFTFSDGLETMGPPGILGWFASLWLGSILLTWMFTGTRGSILVVALFHGTLDIAFSSPVGNSMQTIMGVLITLCGLAALVALKRAIDRSAPRGGRQPHPRTGRVRVRTVE